MGLRPCDVVYAVGGVVGDELGDWLAGYAGAQRGGREVDDVEAAVAEDAEVLRGGDREPGLVEGAELNGVTVERSFEHWHC